MTDSTHVRPEGGFSDGSAVIAALTGAYERGWYPADLVHITRRSLGAPEVRLAVWAILYEARLVGAAARAPRHWAEQLNEIAEMAGVNRADEASPIHRTALAALWRHLPRLPAECPPPSRWPHGSVERQAAWTAPVDPKVASRIRGLLAKAERTEYSEEAETFTAKAQELMTKYSVGMALLHARQHGMRQVDVRCRRIHLDNPYLKEKAQLLSEIGRSNGVRTVWFSKLAMATMVGTPLGLDQVELLYTSLLVQATRAMQDAGRHRASPSSTAFRRAFLYGFAIRIGERLRQADRIATESAVAERHISAADLFPVLNHQTSAVEAELTRLFPAAREIRTKPIDTAGWYAGHLAADQARLSPDGTRWSSETLISA